MTNLSPPRRTGVLVAACMAAVLAAAVCKPASAATIKSPVATYTLLGTLNDATGQQGPLRLLGDPMPPALPSLADGLHLSGDYLNAGGQDAQTPYLGGLDTSSFGMQVEFRTSTPVRYQPVLMAGTSYRFLGIYIDWQGGIGIKFNNSNHRLSTEKVSANEWHLADLRYVDGNFDLYFDNRHVISGVLGPLQTGLDRTVSFNDFSSGYAFGGDVRNVSIYNISAVPESSTALLLLCGLALVFLLRNRQGFPQGR